MKRILQLALIALALMVGSPAAQTIHGDQLRDNTVAEVKLDVANSPTTNYVFNWDGVRFEWTTPQANGFGWWDRAGTVVTPANVDDTVSLDHIQFDLTPTLTPVEGMLYWNDDDKTLNIKTETDTVIQVGQEQVVRGTNKTGVTLTNGQVVYIDGAQGNRPTFALAKADAGATSDGTLGIITSDIANNDIGYVTTFGLVRDIDTSTFSAGDLVYLSASTAGGIVNTAPVSPDHLVELGVVTTVDASVGVILARIDNGDELGLLHDVLIASVADGEALTWDSATSTWQNQSVASFADPFFNGAFSESFDALVTSDGATITMSLEQAGGGDLTMQFSDGRTTLDCTPVDTIALTAGTDTAPQSNWIYILQSTKVLTKSTSGWPTVEHIKVAFLFVQSATLVATANMGALVNQNWNDHLIGTNNQGHMAHIGEVIRMHTGYFSGIDGNGSDDWIDITVNGGSPDDVYWKSTSGFTYQMHLHGIPAKDTSGTDMIHVVNDNATPYDAIQNINTQLTDASGASMSGKYFNIIFGIIGNKTGEHVPIVMNLPTGSYNNLTDAINDVDNYDVVSGPREFLKDSTTGLFVCRITFRHRTTGGGTWSVEGFKDLRLATLGGGSLGASTATEFSDGQFAIFDDTDITKKMEFQASGITTGNTRILTIPDESGTIAINRLTTDGDLLVYNSGDVRLALGTDGHVLTADSAGIPKSSWKSPTYTLEFSIFDTNTNVSTGNGIVGKVIPTFANGMDLVSATASYHVKSGPGFTSGLIQVRRWRAGTTKDMLTAVGRISIAPQGYTASTILVSTDDDVVTGDTIFIDVDGITDGFPVEKGLDVTLEFRIP